MNLRSLFRILRAHRSVLVGFPLLAAALGILVATTRPPAQAATASLLLRPFDRAEELVDAANFEPIDFDRYVANEIAVVESRTVAEVAGEALGIDTDEVLDAVTVQGAAKSDIVKIRAEADKGSVAVALANGVAEGYLEVRRRGAVAVTENKIAELNEQIESLEAELSSIEGDIGALPAGSPQAAAAGQRRDAIVTTLAELTRQVRQLSGETRLKRGGAELVDRADKASQGAGVGPISAGIGGAVFGLLLAAAYALLDDRVTERLRSRRDLTEMGIRTPVVGTLPFQTGIGRRGVQALMLRQPNGRFAESVRALRTAVVRHGGDGPPAVLVASPKSGNGRTTTAVNLAIAFAQSGTKTVLVSSDLRKPDIEQVFGIDDKGPGLADLVRTGTRGGVDLPLVQTDIRNLAVIRAGSTLSNPAETVGSATVEKLVEELRGRGATVVLDSPAAIDYTDAALLAGWVNSVLVVVSSGTRADDVRQALSLLSVGPGTSVALVMNRATED